MPGDLNRREGEVRVYDLQRGGVITVSPQIVEFDLYSSTANRMERFHLWKGEAKDLALAILAAYGEDG